jgi:hypothetical protein
VQCASSQRLDATSVGVQQSIGAPDSLVPPTGQSGAPQNRKAANHMIRSRCTVHCAPDSSVHLRTEGNQGLPNGALMAPRSLGAIKGTHRRMELHNKHPLNILQHRNFASTQLFNCDRDLSTSLSCDSVVLFHVFFS